MYLRYIVNNHMLKVNFNHGHFITTGIVAKSQITLSLYCSNMQTTTVGLKYTRMVLINVDQRFIQLFMLVTLTLSVCVTNANSGILLL